MPTANSKRIFLIVTLLTFGALTNTRADIVRENTKAVGVVSSLEGTLEVLHGRSSKKLSKGSSVYENDLLRTRENSKALIKLGDNAAALQLNANSKILVKKPSAESWLLKIDAGSLLSFFNGSKDNPKEPFKVQTKTAVIGVRGTSFFVDVDQKKGEYFCPCHGKINVKTKSANTTITSEHHDQPKYFSKSGLINSTEDKIGHSDAEGDVLKKLVTQQ